jgi:thioredoxin reductase (NADPH)
VPRASLAAARAQGSLRDVVVFDATKDEEEAIAARAMFVFIGSEPRVAWLRGRVGLDEKGFVLTGTAADRSRQSLAHRGQRCASALEADLAGVFAAGDVRSGPIKRVAAAVGEGAMAIQFVHGYLRDLET